MTPAARLRDLLQGDTPVVAPGAYNALFARLVEDAGFPAVYLTGAGVANSLLGRPDLGIASMAEMVMVAERICEVTSIPLIADGDTGYGGVHNVARAVRSYERAGVAAIQLEDQVFPKKCGHFDGKEIVPVGEMVQRIEAAKEARSGPDGMLIIARTDARGPVDLDEAIRRARTYGEAGADVLFVEAPRSLDELTRVGMELSEWPLMANMVEFGKTPLTPAAKLGELGFSLVIFPGSISRATTRTAQTLLTDLATTGTTEGSLDQMATFLEVNAVVGLDDANAWEQHISDVASERP